MFVMGADCQNFFDRGEVTDADDVDGFDAGGDVVVGEDVAPQEVDDRVADGVGDDQFHFLGGVLNHRKPLRGLEIRANGERVNATPWQLSELDR